MLYTVGEVAKILKVAPSTIRYYDKEGLLPFVERSGGGIRMFKEQDFDWLFMIECLKKSGLSIKDIKRYIDMTLQGDATMEARLKLFCTQRERVAAQIRELQDTLDILNYKCWFYETAVSEGTTDVPRNMPINEIPKAVRGAKEKLNRLHR